jgi:uncharacterized tellurite resistance protein B-like protein
MPDELGSHHHDAFLRVLAAAAWADGKIVPAELNALKRWAKDLGVGTEGWARLEPYIDEPVTGAEAEMLVRDFFDRISVPSERRALIAAVEDLTKADGHVDPRERELIESLSFATQGASAVDVVLGRLRGLFGIEPATSKEKTNGNGGEPFRHEEMETFRSHRLLFRLRRRLRAAALDASDRDLELLACWATLLARVAGADSTVTEAEKERIRGVLANRVALAPPILDLVVRAVCEAAKDDLDRSRSVAVLMDRTTPEHRIDVLEALFEVAAADGALEPKAVTEVRAVAKALQIPDASYADAKGRASKPPAAAPQASGAA